MKAIQIKEYGDARVLKLSELPTPKPGKDEVLVQLKAIGINFIDIYMRIGRYPQALPFTPGYEGAGVVATVGDEVKDFKPGDRVAYTSVLGSYAQYNVVKAWQLIPLPKDLSFEQGAAFPLQGLTAQYLLHDFYKIRPGDQVLIHAAAGGVGRLLVQWAKHLGAKIIATVSTEQKAKVAKDAGADHIILYSEQDFVEEVMQITAGRGVDYIIDGVGKSTFNRDLDAVRVYGHICLFGSASGPAEPFAPNALQAKSLTLSGGRLFNCCTNRQDLLRRTHDLFQGLREGWLSLKVDYVFSLEDAAKAHHMLEGRQTTGKVILTV